MSLRFLHAKADHFVENSTTVIHDTDHPAMLTGSFTCGALSADPFMVLRGKIRLFDNDPRTPDTKNISYDFDMVGTDGERFHFNGYQVVDPSIAFGPWRTWKATSTLYVTLTRLKDNSVAGRGVLRITPKNLSKQLASFSTTGLSLRKRAGAAGQFLTYFAKQTASLFFSPLTSLMWPKVSVKGYLPKIPPADTVEVVASDGVKTTLRMWTPVKSASTQLPLDVPVLFVPGTAVDHNIFAWPTIQLNAMEYFTSSGATCFCITHRAGKTTIAQAGWTTYDALLDVAAAINHTTNRYRPGTKGYI